MTPEMERAKQVANTIYQQLGGMAVIMMGAKQFRIVTTAEGFGLSFRIGRNSRRVNRVEIVLTWKDLYRIEFGNIGKTHYDILHVSEDVYVEDLHQVISNNTGMYLSL